MTERPKPQKRKLEDEVLWNEANAIAQDIYKVLHKLPEEEKWDTTRMLRQSANELIFYIGQALGNGAPTGTEFDFGYARKAAAGLKTMYRFAGRQEFIELEPEMMVRLDTLIKEIDKELDAAHERLLQGDMSELDQWRERNKQWRKTTDER